MTANPSSSSAYAVVRAAPGATWAKLARFSEPELAASSSSPASSETPLILPNTSVNSAPVGRPGLSPVESGEQVERDRQGLPGEQQHEGALGGDDHRDRGEGERAGRAQPATPDDRLARAPTGRARRGRTRTA